MISKKLSDIVSHELARQENELEMIASENYVSNTVLQAYSNVFTNKYSEWYPGARYYGWQKYVDELEQYTQQLALQIFWLSTEQWAVNVQSLSWSPANLAVYMGILNPWDTVLAMSLNAWGHLSHGHKLNSSAIYYNFISYGVKQWTYDIDYEEIRSKALESRPKMIVAWFSAYPKNIDWENFAAIADEVSNVHGYRPLLMADISHIAGLIAGGVLSSPFSGFDIVTTTTHKTLRGPRGAMIYMKKDDRDLEKKINRGVFPGLQWWPHVHEIFAKAVALEEILQPDFKSYASKVVENAQLLARELVNLWWDVLTGDTENHIVLVDVTKRKNPSKDNENWQETTLTWKIAESVLEQIGISINKNLLPFDERKPMDPSGVRIGTPAVTSRWLWVEQMKQLASIISRAWENASDEQMFQQLHKEVQELCEQFPLRYR